MPRVRRVLLEPHQLPGWNPAFLSLCGPRERIRERLGEWKGSGATTIMVAGDAAAVRTMAELAL